jgi:hypothetical protein
MAAERLELPAFCHLAFVVGVIARLAPMAWGRFVEPWLAK